MATLDLKDMATMLVNVPTAIPYAGITQVRFKGYFLSPVGTPHILLYNNFNVS